jgi:hypothetical protein
MGAGEMRLRGGASKLLDGRFEYNVADWKPQVTTSDTNQVAAVTIKQSGNHRMGGNGKNLWNLALNNKVPLDLKIELGAGEALLYLGSLNLRTLDVSMGAGKVDADLRGTPAQSYDVHIKGGVGQAKVQLPTGVGIRAEAHGGFGSIDVSGLEKKGDYYENALYNTAKVNVRVTVEGGIGEIQLIG